MSMRYQAGIVLPGYNALKVANAPTIGTASVASGTSVSVAFTAPSCVGGGAISSYTAYCTTTGTKSATGASSPLVVTGLTSGTAYTFKVFATNAYGPSYPSASSNSVTPPPVGQDAYTVAGTYSWVAPVGTTSVSIVVVGGGGPGQGIRCQVGGGSGTSGSAGGGGGLGWRNNYSVTPGNSYTVVVGAAGISCTTYSCGGSSYFCSTSVIRATGGRSPAGAGVGGTYNGAGTYGGGTGGTGGSFAGSGGAGAAGYSGNGGNGTNGYSGSSGSGGGGGGGVKFAYADVSGQGGGGVGILGQGSNGAGGTSGSCGTCLNLAAGGGGSGGAMGGKQNNGQQRGGVGGAYGGGGGGGISYCGNTSGGGNGGVGAVRIIYPGNTRSFPSTCTGDL